MLAFLVSLVWDGRAPTSLASAVLPNVWLWHRRVPTWSIAKPHEVCFQVAPMAPSYDTAPSDVLRPNCSAASPEILHPQHALRCC